MPARPAGYRRGAQEVKGLAGQTAKAPPTSQARISASRTSTGDVLVPSPASAGLCVSEISEGTTAIAAAMEEQKRHHGGSGPQHPAGGVRRQ